MFIVCPKCTSADLRLDPANNVDQICMGCGEILCNYKPAEPKPVPKEELLETVKKQIAVAASVVSEVATTATTYVRGGGLRSDVNAGVTEIKSVPRRLGNLFSAVRKELKDLADQGDQLRGKK